MSAIRTILHPTDFSENARYAFQTACAMARESQAKLILLHVMLPTVSPWQQHSPADPMQPAESQESLAKFPWPKPSDPQIRVEHRVAEGNAADEILRLSNLAPCELIVMGTHGRSGMGRFLTGSVAEEVLRKSVCPVLVVKIPLRPAPDLEAETTAGPGEIVDVRPQETTLVVTRTRTLVHTTTTEVVRQIIPAGQEVTGHNAKGDVVVHCLEGRLSITVLGKTQTLNAGQLLHFPADQPYVCCGIDNACVLLTTLAGGPRHA
jgi:nucleotide-binding universal stress UspA family protein/quercetin dioxygenase-like cupin family protein